MGILATDAFTGTGALSASWTTLGGTPTRSSDVFVGGTDGVNNAARYSGATWPNDQYAQCKIISGLSANDRYTIALIRAAGTGATQDYYEFYTDGSTGAGHTEIGTMTHGTEAVLQSIATTFAVNDVVYLEAQGTTLKAKKNGVQVGSNQTDSAFSSGQAGMGLYRATAGLTLDDFEGGDFAAAGGMSARRPIFTFMRGAK